MKFGRSEEKCKPNICKLSSAGKKIWIYNKQTSAFPGKTGFPCRSSANIQPTDHMSTAGPYLVAPRSNSGGLFTQSRLI